MKYTTKLILASSALLVISILSGCNEESDKSYRYFSYSGEECSKIAYSCGQKEETFTNSVGCGCRKSENAPDDVEKRSLSYLINTFIRQKVLQPIYNGKVQGEYATLGGAEEGNMLNYDIYVVVQEFYLKDKRIYYGSKKAGIMQLKIEQTNTNYIIRSYLIFDLDNLGDSDKKMLTPDTLKWLENKEAIKSLQNRIMTGVKQDAAISFGLTMDDFVDSKPKDNSTGESQQFTGTQQSTQQPKV